MSAARLETPLGTRGSLISKTLYGVIRDVVRALPTHAEDRKSRILIGGLWLVQKLMLVSDGNHMLSEPELRATVNYMVVISTSRDGDLLHWTRLSQ